MPNRLDGVGVLVTRPAHQAGNLCRLIEQHGGIAIPFPVIAISHPTNPAPLTDIISRLGAFDIAIFISANAVDYGLQAVNAAGGFPPGILLAAVGRSTANELSQAGYQVDLFPKDVFNSEALLALEALNNVAGKRIVIFRGEGGRELLASTLKQRGAVVEYAECYQRIKSTITPEDLQKLWSDPSPVNVITVTSNEGLQNLYDLVGDRYRQKLLDTPMVVVSERAVQLARQLGFRSPIMVASTASDDAMLEALVNWRAKVGDDQCEP